jgi:hypothetical protein
MPPAKFEPGIQASNWQQTLTLDRSATDVIIFTPSNLGKKDFRKWFRFH